jgi:5,10-methylene-tetrahydrofolate dehydrogenase/methenyl tetrahydrofolate cyclohydrolase
LAAEKEIQVESGPEPEIPEKMVEEPVKKSIRKSRIIPRVTPQNDTDAANKY